MPGKAVKTGVTGGTGGGADGAGITDISGSGDAAGDPKSCSLLKPSVACGWGRGSGAVCPPQLGVDAVPNGSKASCALGCAGGGASGCGTSGGATAGAGAGAGMVKPKFAFGFGWMGPESADVWATGGWRGPESAAFATAKGLSGCDTAEGGAGGGVCAGAAGADGMAPKGGVAGCGVDGRP